MENCTCYGIKYHKIKLNENTYLFFPLTLVEGRCTDSTFLAEETYKINPTFEDLEKESVIIDTIYTEEELCNLYELDDIDFLKEFFLAVEQENIVVIQKEKQNITKRKINLAKFLSTYKSVEEYTEINKRSVVTLNDAAIESLLTIEDLEQLKKQLQTYKTKIESFNEKKKKERVTKITVEDGQVKDLEVNKKVKTTSIVHEKALPLEEAKIDTSISLRGLETYIKERVFGHDEEIKRIAKTMFMNYTAVKGEKVEPMLLVGPTGTGKTETIKAAMHYFNLPFLEVNAINLVPQGIKGLSLEDCLYSLLLSADYVQEKAEKGLLFFDEFDKLGSGSEEFRSSMPHILLKFIEGTKMFIERDDADYTFDTSLLGKVFAGTFSDLLENKKPIGYNPSKENPRNIMKKIVKEDYFGKELITRIPHLFLFNDLSRLEKKRALLESKLSEISLKKKRYQRQFQVDLVVTDSYIEAILDALEEEEKSMREMNNRICQSLDCAEYELLNNVGKYKRLVLTRETVEDSTKFKIE